MIFWNVCKNTAGWQYYYASVWIVSAIAFILSDINDKIWEVC